MQVLASKSYCSRAIAENIKKFNFIQKNCHKIFFRLESGGESSSSRKVVFPDKLTFTLASKEEGGGQRFRCAKIVQKSNNEVTLETFTQSQCYRLVKGIEDYAVE